MISDEEIVELEVDCGVSPYAKFFNSSCPKWTKEPEYNLMLLRQIQEYCNDKLKHRGVVFLNEVYDQLGLPRTKAGQVVGWVYDQANPTGDNYIDFGIYNERNQDFINGYENVVLLDFNVDGMVLDTLKE